MTPPEPRPSRPAPAGDEAERARQRAAVFGDVLPETTGDEREPGPPADGSEEWLRRNVPPHHG